MEKIKRQRKAPEKQVIVIDEVNIDDELRRLDIERRILIKKLKQQKEITRLQRELNEV